MTSLLPKSYQSELMLALESILREFENLPADVVKNFWNPQKCPQELLPLLASYLGVSQWDSSWDIKQKRAMCQNALIVNKQKGTLKSLKEALKSLNLNATIIEWWQVDETKKLNDQGNNLQKGMAEINLHSGDIIYSQEQYRTIYRLINDVKRLSLRLSFKKTNGISGNLMVGSSLGLLNKIHIPFSQKHHVFGDVYGGGSCSIINKIHI